MNDSEEFKPSLKQINEDIRPTWEDIKRVLEIKERNFLFDF